ncbi:hypothetical protein B0H11DRAFT_2341873 [Mycena galericulata]|nr:hypothetical protein B0H11DRAFT_2341873 [Mycena galericulata]
MVNITQATLAAAFSSCLLVDFQGFLLTNFANLPPPPVSNIPAVVLAPGANITAGQVWNITSTSGTLGPAYAINNFTTGMFLGYSQTFIQSFSQAVLQGAQANLNILPAVGIPGAVTPIAKNIASIAAELGNAVLTSWQQVGPLNHGAVTWEFARAGLPQQVWTLRAAESLPRNKK